MPVHSELGQLAIVALAALLCGMGLTRIKQPAIVGYILAGIILGPSALGLVENRANVELLAELGVLLLLFAIGMKLSLRAFRTIYRVALLAAAMQIVVAVVITLGAIATRRSSSGPDEYFLAGRRLGPLVLFMALFGTNSTSFVLLAIPAMAYVHGVGVFGLNAPIVALGIPMTFWAIGSPARRMAKRLGALTPAELYRERFGSPLAGAMLFEQAPTFFR